MTVRVLSTVRDVPGTGGVREANAAAVLSAIRAYGPLSRRAIARHTSLSMPTVSRQVSTLIELGLLSELPDPPLTGEVGRPTVPVDLNSDVIAACGVHIGVTTTTYGLSTLRGELLDSERIPTPSGAPEEVLRRIAREVEAFLGDWPERRIIGVGLAIGGQVDVERGLLDHEPLGWHGVPARTIMEEITALPVYVDGHVPAMATAELLFGEATHARSALYFYAREMVGAAVAVGGVLHRGPGQSGSIAHLPVGSDVLCPCGRTGCLEATVSERSVLERAVRAGVLDRPDIRTLHEVAAAGDAIAHRILTERAHALGRAVALLRDIVNPELVVLAGQAITDAPAYLDAVYGAYADTTVLPDRGLMTVTRFGPDVQAMAACAGLLARLYERPFSMVGVY
ncbi:Sugar kinase of the NBD/HSP70 family, may contain an N-terminal HTH domain [Saccharomonospora viridis]|uniref:Transcriptional regulator/sugar kinase n=1 Tax=Saccharomonospora viridis (strain ATCC 15386 / DSM 43017 / JCM 3036 / CCUG 5913 / NBRC 12207 / NCIMB 9602 / P101) TaxID=471857 RepID=C7MXP3_SACVD|nr:transcriptional regulator/sugar kinase [Saccharomonospora viridis DSM 43017]SFO76579.1 Sugar kinase of the NBD/HSP70 family, may contain an N-terminal HTH domain [Saccharomonospora viridis]